jgi:hypothetical protein
MKIIEVPLPYLTTRNKLNRVYAEELDEGTKAYVVYEVPDNLHTPLKNVVGNGIVIADNQLKIEFYDENNPIIPMLITGELVVVPRGLGEQIQENNLYIIKNYELLDFNIIQKNRSSFG